MPYPKGKPQSEEANRKRREAMLARVAAGKFNRDFYKAAFTPDAVAKRVATNRANGNMARSVAAMSASQARPEVRAALAARRRERAKTPEGHAKIMLAVAAAQAPEVNERRRKASRSYALTPEGRQAKIKGGNAALQSHRGAASRREWEYRGHRFRSSWELRFARWLDSLGVQWMYEPRTFILPDGRGYTPDFLVFVPGRPPVWVEIKGHRQSEKFWAFHAVEPSSVLLIEEHVEVLP